MAGTKSKPKDKARRKLHAPDQRILKAMNHPIRFAALSILTERVASPSDIAKELDETVGAVAYHIRELRNLGAIELVDTAQRRGAVESYYRATVRPWFSDAEYARLPARRRRELLAPTVRSIVDDSVRALASGGFDHQAVAARMTIDVDDQAQEEISGLLTETIKALDEIHAQAKIRIASNQSKHKRTEVVLMSFEPSPIANARAKKR